MNSGGRFIIGFIGTMILLIFVSMFYFNLPIDSTLIMVFLFSSVIVGILLALKSRGVHAGHSVTGLGIIILIVSGTIVSGAIDLTVNGETRPKLWEIPQSLFTQLVILIGVGLLLLVVGLFISWKKMINR